MSDKFLSKKLDKIIRWLRFHQAVDLVPEESVVCDIGCGHDCLFLFHIQDKIVSGVGIDRSVDHSIENEKIKVYQGDVQFLLPLKDQSVEVVTMMALIEHLDYPEQALKEIYRILKPGGKIILTTPNTIAKPILEFLAFKLKWIDSQEIKDHRQYFSKSYLKSYLKNTGFKNIKVKTFELGFNLLATAKK